MNSFIKDSVFFKLVVFIVILGMSSCNNKDSLGNNNKNVNEELIIQSIEQANNLLSGKKAMMQRMLVDGKKVIIDDCGLDDEIFFHKDKTFFYRENIPCAQNDSDSKGVWKIEKHNEIIVAIIDDDIDGRSVLEILSYKNNEIKSRFFENGSNNNTIEVVVFWKIF